MGKYEELRKKNKILHKNLCKILKEVQHVDPSNSFGKPEQLIHN